jgi:hypothetical protein
VAGLGQERAPAEAIERRVDLRMTRQQALARPDAPQLWVIVNEAVLRQPNVVYIEQLTTAIYLDRREDVEHYAEVMERLCVAAEPPDHTAKMLCGLLREL